MRKLFTLCLLVFSLSASAQWQQTGSKVRYVNGLGIPTKDTAAGVAADSSQILIRPADSSLYIKYKRTWVKVGSGGTIGGSGTTNYIPKFTSSTAIGNSQIFDNGTNVGVGTATPGYKLDVTGDIRATGQMNVGVGSNLSGAFINESDASKSLTIAADPSNFGANSFMRFNVDNSERMRITSGGNALIGTTTDNGTDRLQVSGNTLSTRYKVNTSGQTLEINNYYAGGTGRNIWIGGGGASSTSAAWGNLAVGDGAMSATTSGFFNTAIGASALQLHTTGDRNVAIGFEALYSTTSGTRNVGLGANALGTNSTGSNNMAIGTGALLLSTTAGDNVAVGSDALRLITTGSNNIAFGTDAGRRISAGGDNQTSSQSIYIGQDTRASANGNTNEVVIGYANIGQGSNTVTLGNSSITKTFLRGSVMVNTTTDNGVDKLQVSGSIQGTGFDQAYLARTTAYTATDTDYLIDCTTGTFTVTLPASSGRTGRILIIKNSGTGTITVDGNAAETIDGAATYSLATQYATVQIMSDGTNWKIIAKF